MADFTKHKEGQGAAPSRERNRSFLPVALFLLFGALSYLSTMYRVAVFGRPNHPYARVESGQLNYHRNIMNNVAPAPYQYRILGEIILEELLKVGEQQGVRAFSVFIIFKMALHLLIFWLAYLFFRRLQLGLGASLFGVVFIFYAILASYYNEDLVYYQYLDFLFFLAVFLLILKNSDFWLVPLTFLAMLNKETAAALPFVYLANRLEFPRRGQWKGPQEWLSSVIHKTPHFRRVVFYFAILLAVAVGAYAGVRLHFGTERNYVAPAPPGWGLLELNLTHKYFYINWLVFFNFLLFTPWPQWNRKPAFIKRSAAVLLPFLILGNLFLGAMAEVRIFFCFLPLLLVAGLINCERWARPNP